MPHADLLNLRLAPDMFTLARQFVIALDGARGCGARLAGLNLPDAEAPDFAVFNRGDDSVSASDPRSSGELSARVEATRTYLQSLPRDAIDASIHRPIILQMYGRTRTFKTRDFVLNYVLPNFYFHLSMAYALLRQAGVCLGKQDFEGPPVYEGGAVSLTTGH